MKRTTLPLLLLAVALPLALAGCARSGGTMSDGDMTRSGVIATPMPVEAGTDDARRLLGATTSESNTILENARAIPNLSGFVELAQAAGLDETLSGPGEYTVFAPTNEAFDLIDKDDLDRMMMSEAERENLAQLLRSHVSDDEVMFGELNDGQVVVMLSGADIPVARQTNDPLAKRIGEADFIVYDIESSNGVIHVINLVLDPEGFFSQM